MVTAKQQKVLSVAKGSYISVTILELVDDIRLKILDHSSHL